MGRLRNGVCGGVPTTEPASPKAYAKQRTGHVLAQVQPPDVGLWGKMAEKDGQTTLSPACQILARMVGR